MSEIKWYLTKTHNSWQSMHRRCYEKQAKSFLNYWGRGITVCTRWHQYENFIADMGERPDGCTIERIDVDGHYEPSNCRWATAIEQAQNRRNTIRLQGQSLASVASAVGVNYSTAAKRLKTGKEPSRVLLAGRIQPAYVFSAPTKRNQSGFRGVSQWRDTGRWRANVTVDGKQLHLGVHESPEAAHAAYLLACEVIARRLVEGPLAAVEAKALVRGARG